MEITDPDTGKPALRETNTMPQWAGSCWYYLRFLDPKNNTELVAKEFENYWMPVDIYVGGSEHAVLHLLYARFWHKVLFDAGIISTSEPFKKLVHQGMILGELEYAKFEGEDNVPISADFISSNKDSRTGSEVKRVVISADDVKKDGEHFVLANDASIKVEARAHKMSKSRGNVVNPDEVINSYGADAFRLYEMFMGPLEQVKPWSTRGVEGTYRFLNRVWRLMVGVENGAQLSKAVCDKTPTPEQLKVLHQTILKVTNDIQELRFNTAISALMEFINTANKWDVLPREIVNDFVLLLSPLAPHIAEELWERLGNTETIAYMKWPEFDEKYLKSDTAEVSVQVNGKMRSRVSVPSDATEAEALAIAKNDENVARHIANKKLARSIYVSGRIINFVTRN